MAAARQVVPVLFVVPTGIVNNFLIDAPDGCVLVDAGLPGRDVDILRGVAESGRRPTDVRHLIVTHAHSDHIGSLADVRSATVAAVYCHPADSPIVTAGGGFRPLRVTPGVVNWLVWRRFIGPILRRCAGLSSGFRLSMAVAGRNCGLSPRLGRGRVEVARTRPTIAGAACDPKAVARCYRFVILR